METHNAKKQCCFVRRHLPAAVESYHRYALNVSRKSGVFYSDARRDAQDFGVGKNTITRWMDAMETAGFAVRQTTGPRQKRNKLTGTYESIPFTILDHDEFAAKNPGTCRFMNDDDQSPKQGQAEESPVPVLDSTSPHFVSHQSPFCDSPVPKTGTKNVKRECKERERRGTDAPVSSSNSQNQPQALPEEPPRLPGGPNVDDIAWHRWALLREVDAELSEMRCCAAWLEDSGAATEIVDEWIFGGPNKFKWAEYWTENFRLRDLLISGDLTDETAVATENELESRRCPLHLVEEWASQGMKTRKSATEKLPAAA